MARATRASGERNPKAMRVSRRSLVHALHPGVGQPVDEGGLDADTVAGDGLGQLHEGGDATPPGPLQPGVEQGDALFALESEHLAQLLLSR